MACRLLSSSEQVGSDLLVSNKRKNVMGERSMRRAILGYFVLANFALQLGSVPRLDAAPPEISEHKTVQKVALAPSNEGLTLVSMIPLHAGGRLWGGVAAYDDPSTTRPADYVELFNNVGALLAVGWFDPFGIERVAVDKGLFEEAEDLQGVFVLLLTGDPV
jgi:hypothetical protein